MCWWKRDSAEAATSTKPYDMVNVAADGSTAAATALEVLSNLSGRDGWRLSADRLAPDRARELVFHATSNRRDATTFLIEPSSRVDALADDGWATRAQSPRSAWPRPSRPPNRTRRVHARHHSC